MIPKSGNRFPACAKPRKSRLLPFDVSAGEGRSDKIMRKTIPVHAKASRKSIPLRCDYGFRNSPLGADIVAAMRAIGESVREIAGLDRDGAIRRTTFI
jgi:hypothetical protein